jgi:ribosomal-protein-alanine N-acetyltransferase
VNSLGAQHFSPRPAAQADLKSLVEIEARAQVAPWSMEHFQKELEKPFSEILVLSDDETDEQIAGFVVFWIMGQDCQIMELAIDLPYRGMGYARQLLAHAVKKALRAECSRVILEVRRSNAAAIALYQGQKFTISHVRKGFYSNGEDAFVMELDLLDQAALKDF